MILAYSLGRKGGMTSYYKSLYPNIESNLVNIESLFNPDRIADGFVIPTYRNNIEFLLSSVTVLPALMMLSVYLILKNKIKVAYFPYFHLWSMPLIIVLRLFRVHVVFTVHDAVNHAGDENLFEAFSLKNSIKSANSYIFLTHFVKKEAEEMYGLKNKKKVVIPQALLDYPGLKKKEELDEIRSFLFFGRVSKYKGVEMLLEALSNNENFQDKELTIAGKSNYVIDYSRYNVSGLKVIDKFLSDEEIVELFNTHDALIIPYTEATQSGPITLGISSLMTMIITDVGGLKEQVSDNEAFFCHPNVIDLKDTINIVAKDGGIRGSRYNNLMKHNKNLRWDCIATKLDSFLNEINVLKTYI